MNADDRARHLRNLVRLRDTLAGAPPPLSDFAAAIDYVIGDRRRKRFSSKSQGEAKMTDEVKPDSLVLFIVRNSDAQPFPIEMLTMDRCFPMSHQDGGVILDSHKDRRSLSREVRLYARATGDTLSRDAWASRGWPISSAQQIR